MKEEIIINAQIAFFFKEPLSKPEQYWLDLNTEMSGIFDQTPIILPIPDEKNLYDVPVVQLLSNTGVYSCKIARSRLDFFLAGVGKQKYSEIKDDLLTKTQILFNYFKNKVQIKRFGFVVRFFLEDSNQDLTIAQLINNDFKKIHKGKSHETYLRYASRLSIADLAVNNVSTLEKFTAKISEIDKNLKGILITRDFNTIPEEDYSQKFNDKLISFFMHQCEDKFNLSNILSILYDKESKSTS